MLSGKVFSRILKRSVYVLLIMNRVIGGIVNGNISHFQTLFRDFNFKKMHFLLFFFVFFSPVFIKHSNAIAEIGTEIIAAKTADTLRILVFTNILE